jgi:CheY-like chemotaxis protein
MKLKRYQRKRILLVDDEPSFTSLVDLYLQSTGFYDVRVVNASTQAVRAAREFQPDLILLDMSMPGMDGGELASCLGESPKLRTVPIVLVTAMLSKNEVSARKGVICGLPVLAKPVRLKELVDCVSTHMLPGEPRFSVVAGLN